MADNCLPEDVNGGKIVPKRRDKANKPPTERYGAEGYYEEMRADVAAWKTLAIKAETERDNALEILRQLDQTGDGVPITPNMPLFVLDQQDDQIYQRRPYGPLPPSTIRGPVEWSDCFSTYEAAEKARSKTA